MTADDGYMTTGDGVRLFFRTLGSGARTLVMPNGLYLLDDFQYLAADRTLIAYDPRHRGRSDAVTDPVKRARGIEQDIDDLDEMRRHHGVDRIDLLGHSYMGFMVAVYAMRYPSHVNRVVQIGPMQAEALKQYPAHLANNDATLAEVFARVAELQRVTVADDPETRCRKIWEVLRLLYVNDSRDADRVNWGRCELENERNMMRYWLSDLLPSIRGLVLRAGDFAKAQLPVLTIHGTKDRSSPYGAGRDWAALLPQARLLTVPNAAHAPWVEAPDVVFGAVKTFLDGAWPTDAQMSATVTAAS